MNMTTEDRNADEIERLKYRNISPAVAQFAANECERLREQIIILRAAVSSVGAFVENYADHHFSGAQEHTAAIQTFRFNAGDYLRMLHDALERTKEPK